MPRVSRAKRHTQDPIRTLPKPDRQGRQIGPTVTKKHLYIFWKCSPAVLSSIVREPREGGRRGRARIQHHPELTWGLTTKPNAHRTQRRGVGFLFEETYQTGKIIYTHIKNNTRDPLSPIAFFVGFSTLSQLNVKKKASSHEEQVFQSTTIKGRVSRRTYIIYICHCWLQHNSCAGRYQDE